MTLDKNLNSLMARVSCGAKPPPPRAPPGGGSVRPEVAPPGGGSVRPEVRGGVTRATHRRAPLYCPQDPPLCRRFPFPDLSFSAYSLTPVTLLYCALCIIRCKRKRMSRRHPTQSRCWKRRRWPRRFEL